jgi:hypothetical protein
LHDGLEPESVGVARVRRAPRYLVHLGDVHAVEYFKRVDDDGDGQPNEELELYRHEFEPHARPAIDHDDAEQIHFTGGRYRVTERGITDMPKHRKNMFSMPRGNPEYTSKEIIVRGVGTALTAVLSMRVLGAAVDPLITSDRIRSVAKAAASFGLSMWTAKKYPFIAAGFVVGGGLEIVGLAYREFGLDRYEALARERVAALSAGIRGTTGAIAKGVPSWPVTDQRLRLRQRVPTAASRLLPLIPLTL